MLIHAARAQRHRTNKKTESEIKPDLESVKDNVSKVKEVINRVTTIKSKDDVEDIKMRDR